MGIPPDGTCDFEYRTQPDIEVSAAVGEDLQNDAAVNAVSALD